MVSIAVFQKSVDLHFIPIHVLFLCNIDTFFFIFGSFVKIITGDVEEVEDTETPGSRSRCHKKRETGSHLFVWDVLSKAETEMHLLSLSHGSSLHFNYRKAKGQGRFRIYGF